MGVNRAAFQKFSDEFFSLFSYLNLSFVLELATRLLLWIGMDWTTHKSLRCIEGREVNDFHFGEIMR